MSMWNHALVLDPDNARAVECLGYLEKTDPGIKRGQLGESTVELDYPFGVDEDGIAKLREADDDYDSLEVIDDASHEAEQGASSDTGSSRDRAKTERGDAMDDGWDVNDVGLEQGGLDLGGAAPTQDPPTEQSTVDFELGPAGDVSLGPAASTEAVQPIEPLGEPPVVQHDPADPPTKQIQLEDAPASTAPMGLELDFSLDVDEEEGSQDEEAEIGTDPNLQPTQGYDGPDEAPTQLRADTEAAFADLQVELSAEEEMDEPTRELSSIPMGEIALPTGSARAPTVLGPEVAEEIDSELDMALVTDEMAEYTSERMAVPAAHLEAPEHLETAREPLEPMADVLSSAAGDEEEEEMTIDRSALTLGDDEMTVERSQLDWSNVKLPGQETTEAPLQDHGISTSSVQIDDSLLQFEDSTREFNVTDMLAIGDQTAQSAPVPDFQPAGLEARSESENAAAAEDEFDEDEGDTKDLHLSKQAVAILRDEPAEALAGSPDDELLRELRAKAPDGDESSTLCFVIGELLEQAEDQYMDGEERRAAELALIAVEQSADSAAAQKLIHERQTALTQLLSGHMGDLKHAPVLTRPLMEIPMDEIDNRAAFLLTQVDGAISYEDILDVSGMPRLEALGLLSRLVIRGHLS